MILKIPDKETCWAKNALNTHCLGRKTDSLTFSKKEKIEFLNNLSNNKKNYIVSSIYNACMKNLDLLNNLILDEHGWIYFKGDIPYIHSKYKDWILEPEKKLVWEGCWQWIIRRGDNIFND